MRLFGFEITRVKAPAGLQAVYDRPSMWWPIVREPFTGAWQRNKEIRVETISGHNAVYACVTLIAQDVSKMRLRLVEQDNNRIWVETDSPAFSPVLRKPNRYQTRIKFVEQWVISKLLHGNAYILKERDARGVVVAMYVLDPTRAKALVAPDGSVFYEFAADNLSGIKDTVTIPASEVIHDTMVPLYHPLCGVSPLTACGLAALQGMAIQRSSTAFFQNGSRPAGILTAPAHIPDSTAARIKEYWESQYGGDNVGKTAVLGDGLTYAAMGMTAVDSQLIDQLKWSAETVCSCFHVPPYMIGVGQMPTYNNIQALNQQYYVQCLQAIIESIELCLDEGLGLTTAKDGRLYGTEFDLDDLLRMDTATLIEAESKAIGAGIKKPNESRARLNLPAVKGGDTPYLQQQNYALSALAKRDAQDDPFAINAPAPPAANDNPPSDEEIDNAAAYAASRLKSLLVG